MPPASRRRRGCRGIIIEHTTLGFAVVGMMACRSSEDYRVGRAPIPGRVAFWAGRECAAGTGPASRKINYRPVGNSRRARCIIVSQLSEEKQ